MANRDVVTRFAPSPTGSLHVGGARTALYNWAFARRHGGMFILRLEDTDRARSTLAAALEILAALDWLGIDWDEGPRAHASDPLSDQDGPRGPYCQSQRLAIYDTFVERLLSMGRAYEDGGAVRFRVPAADLSIRDAVLGEVMVPAGEIQDFIIRKADGFPTYHLGVVVDDATMGVTHVIRGQEHLNNALKHRALQAALDLPVPVFAHIPLIFNPDGSKMSKRDKARAARMAATEWLSAHGGDEAALAERILAAGAADDRDLTQAAIGPTELEAFLSRRADDLATAKAIARALDLTLPEIDVVDFRQAGYLHEVLCNYLALLGWNPGGDIERFDAGFLCQHFSLERIGRSHAKFDRAKLASFNQQAIADLDPQVWAERLYTFDTRYAHRFGTASAPSFIAFALAYQVRSVTLADPARLGVFFLVPDDAIHYNDTLARERAGLAGEGEGHRLLAQVRPVLADLETWTAPTLQAALEAFAAQHQVGLGKVAQPIRFAVSGSNATPPIDATLNILGRQSSLARIERCMAEAGSD